MGMLQEALRRCRCRCGIAPMGGSSRPLFPHGAQLRVWAGVGPSRWILAQCATVPPVMVAGQSRRAQTAEETAASAARGAGARQTLNAWLPAVDALWRVVSLHSLAYMACVML